MFHPELDQEYKLQTILVTHDEDGEPLETPYYFTKVLDWEWKRTQRLDKRPTHVRVQNNLPFGYAQAVDIVEPYSEQDR